MSELLSELGQAALHYAARGLHVFPLRPRDKRPATQHGVKDATIDPDIIRAWWTATPDANIGLACGPSNVVVIDLDGPQGIEMWEAVSDTLGLNVATRTVLTGGGGKHLYFKAPANVKIGNSAGKLGKGIDVRADGGYCVLPPSIHPNGKRYKWE
jgi:hypothetical protein